ncbi:MAG: hypothetical protein J0H68_04435 [Sphingobacteriia bacterium]|nr:hypothetical protein [Sphingobacteriia bacterium]
MTKIKEYWDNFWTLGEKNSDNYYEFKELAIGTGMQTKDIHYHFEHVTIRLKHLVNIFSQKILGKALSANKFIWGFFVLPMNLLYKPLAFNIFKTWSYKRPHFIEINNSRLKILPEFIKNIALGFYNEDVKEHDAKWYSHYITSMFFCKLISNVLSSYFQINPYLIDVISGSAVNAFLQGYDDCGKQINIFKNHRNLSYGVAMFVNGPLMGLMQNFVNSFFTKFISNSVVANILTFMTVAPSMSAIMCPIEGKVDDLGDKYWPISTSKKTDLRGGCEQGQCGDVQKI